MDIAVIGSNNVDLITYVDRMPVWGETLEAPDFALGFGGKGANQAVAASRLGSKVIMVGRVGNDMFADMTLANLGGNGIDTTHVLRTEASSGVAPISVDPLGRNSILIVKGANGLLTPADVDAARAAIADCRLVVLQLEVPLETVHHAVDLGRELGVPVLVNPAPADPELDVSRLAGVDWLVPNETELAALTGLPTGDLADVETAAIQLLQCGVRNVVVTLGERGALWVQSGRSTVDGQPTRPEVVLVESVGVHAVDSTGAGDAFIGAFAHGLVHDVPVMDALDLANRYAADSVTRRGTQTSYATAEEFRG